MVEVTRTQFTMARFENGNRIGLPFSFDSILEAREHAKDAARYGDIPIFEFAWTAYVKDCDRPDGLCIDEIRTLHREGSLNGERIFA
jgi:hypothetical protein